MDSKNLVILALCAVAISALPNSIVPEASFDETDSTPQSELAQLRQSIKVLAKDTTKIGSKLEDRESQTQKQATLPDCTAKCDEDHGDVTRQDCVNTCQQIENAIATSSLVQATAAAAGCSDKEAKWLCELVTTYNLCPSFKEECKQTCGKCAPPPPPPPTPPQASCSDITYGLTKTCKRLKPGHLKCAGSTCTPADERRNGRCCIDYCHASSAHKVVHGMDNWFKKRKADAFDCQWQCAHGSGKDWCKAWKFVQYQGHSGHVCELYDTQCFGKPNDQWQRSDSGNWGFTNCIFDVSDVKKARMRPDYNKLSEQKYKQLKCAEAA